MLPSRKKTKQNNIDKIQQNENKEKKFVPAKGQKSAVKRLDKIKGIFMVENQNSNILIKIVFN